MNDIFTQPSEQRVPLASDEIQTAMQNESRGILTRQGDKMTKADLKQFIIETLKEQKTKSKKYAGKKHKASAGSVSAIKKSDDSAGEAVKAGKFDWASSPFAAAQSAHIVATGEPTVKKGSKKNESAHCSECGLPEAQCECGAVMKEQSDYYGYTKDRPDDMKYFGPTLKKYKMDPGIVRDFSQVWNEQEVRNPAELKVELEQGYGYHEMPLEFYVAMASAIKRYNSAYDKFVGSAYTPGWID